jgi:hypothetical protein
MRKMIESGRRRRGAAPVLALGSPFKDITDPSDRMEELAIKWIIDLCAKPPHMDFDNVRIAFEVDVPDLLGDQRPRQNFARAAQKQRQQLEFLGRKVEQTSAAQRAMPVHVQL